MILLTILLVTVIAAAVALLISVFIGGIGFALTFGDVLVFALVVWLIVKHFRKKKKENKENEVQ